jgi:putative membrane protein
MAQALPLCKTPVADDNRAQQLAYGRTLLANERTFASWLRTGLSIAGAGLAVAGAAPESARRGVATLLATGFIATGATCILFGARRYSHVKTLFAGAPAAEPALRERAVYLLVALLVALLAGALVILRAR